MGILEDGTPYLTQAGLIAMAGVARVTIFKIDKEWEEFHDKPIQKTRIGFLQDHLFKNGYDDSHLYIEIKKNNSPYHAYPDIVCMAVLAYFAFKSRRPNPTAARNFQSLALFGFRKFVYESLKYVPEDKWKHYRDRVSLLRGRPPEGCFSIFHEITGLIVDLIHHGLPVNSKTVPDISVGQTWGSRWRLNNGDEAFSPRRRWRHDYPEGYPQAKSNPQHPWAYPDEALPAFRWWFNHVYLPTKFPAYILKKAKELQGGKQQAERIARTFQRDALDE